MILGGNGPKHTELFPFLLYMIGRSEKYECGETFDVEEVEV